MAPSKKKMKRSGTTPAADKDKRRDMVHYFFFKPSSKKRTEDQKWQCKKCEELKIRNGGWTNLLNHIGSCVGGDYETQYDHVLASAGPGGMTDYFEVQLSPAETEMFGWIELLVVKNLPLSYVDCPLIRKNSKLGPKCSKTVQKYIFALVNVVRDKIKRKLPSEKFVIMFDGWTEGTDHYIGISASYTDKTGADDESGNHVSGVHSSLLSIKPLLVDEIAGMSASDHLKHISKALKMYGKDVEDILCFVGDNCSVNRRMSKDLDVPLLGCASHKFNLAVREWIKDQPSLDHIIKKVAFVMKKASTLKIAAKLRKLTAYSTVRENDTRWSSTFQMLSRYDLISTELSSINDLLELVLTHLEKDVMSKALKSLTKFNEITVMLQRDGITFVEVRSIMDAVLVDYPELSKHLGDTARIVENPFFEKAVMRIAASLPLTELDRRHASCLLRKQGGTNGITGGDNLDAASSDDGEVATSYALKVQRRLQRRKREASSTSQQYINLDVLPGTSVNCERLFSLAKHILSDTRKTTSPQFFEALLFLKVNREMWNERDVGIAMGRSKSESVVLDPCTDDSSDDGDEELIVDLSQW